MAAQQTVDPWADVVRTPVVFHLEACQDCGADFDQRCDDLCPSLAADDRAEFAEAEANAEANREYDAWGWAG